MFRLFRLVYSCNEISLIMTAYKFKDLDGENLFPFL